MSTQLKCPQCGTPLAVGALEGLCPACLLKQGTESSVAGEKASFEPWPVEEVARWFPQLEIQELIGKGGMGAIYRARQPALDRIVAVKILPGQPAGGSGFAERFNREARALAKLSHPNIVAVHEFGQVAGLHYFIMEFVDGVNLRQLERTQRLSPRQALQIIPQICDALQYAHDEGIVHRDIKPENVLVDRKGRVKIADFGLAKMLGREPSHPRLTCEGQVMGTPHYMAPEQVEHPLEVDHRADIYALGVVFYEMLTGELPLGRFAPPSSKVQVDVRLDEVVLRALEKEPERRYQQAGHVKTAVETISSNPHPAAISSQSDKPPHIEDTAKTEHRWRNLSSTARPPGSPARALKAGLAVFLCVVLAATLITLMLPESFSSTVRVSVAKPGFETPGLGAEFDPYFIQTEFQLVTSQEVLSTVVERLNLGERWAHRYNANRPLSKWQALALLRKFLDIRQSRNTPLIEIRVFDEDSQEAARIANALAEAYREKAGLRRVHVAIVDSAEPSQRPTRPNVPLNLFLGAVIGALLGIGTAIAVFLLVRGSLNSARPIVT